MAGLPSSASGGRVSRRWVLGAGLAGASATMLSACSSEPTGRVAQDAPKASVTPDVKTATIALAAIRATHQAARATTARFPASRASLSALTAMHTAHERTLVDAVPEQARSAAPPAPYAVPRRREAALRRLDASEVRLHDTLQSLALRAQSGDFARLLAGMAAGISVHRGALTSGPRS